MALRLHYRGGMKHIILILLVLVVAVQCNETGSSSSTNSSASTSTSLSSGSSITPIDTSAKANILSDYSQTTSYSKFVLLHNSEDKILIKYDFFPNGYDLCQQATYDENTNPNGCKTSNTIVLPCSFESLSQDDFLSVSINANPNGSADNTCSSPVVLDLDTASITTEGLIFDLSEGAVEIFLDDYEFFLTDIGAFDALDEAKLLFPNTDVTLETIYNSIISKRSR